MAGRFCRRHDLHAQPVERASRLLNGDRGDLGVAGRRGQLVMSQQHLNDGKPRSSLPSKDGRLLSGAARIGRVTERSAGGGPMAFAFFNAPGAARRSTP